MSKIRVTKEFSFEMAHALWNYDGPCRNIHGHSYKLFVTVIGEPIPDPKHTKLGMVIDFSELKKIVSENVISIFDHAVIINKLAIVKYLHDIDQMFEKTIIANYQPTCENIVNDIAGRIKNKLTENAQLYSLRLYETTTSYAEWFASDN